MDRRQLLALLGSAGLGGCLGARSGTEATESTTPATTTANATTETGAPDIGTPDPRGGPSFDSDVKRYVYTPAVGDDAPMRITPADQSGSLPRAEFSFTLANGTDTPFTTNFYAWKVWKRVDGEWFHVAPQMWHQPAMVMRPGDSHTWTLTADNADLDRPIPRAEGTEKVTVVGLGAGTYAFGTDGWFEGDDYQHALGLAAAFELAGEPLALTPTGIDSIERDGETVVVRDEPEAGEDLGAYVVTRTDDSSAEFRRVISEQVIRDTPLRNALAHFESGVERVRLEAGTTTYPAFGVGEPRHLEYEGETYRVETERLEEGSG